MLAVWAGLAARMPPEPANPVARKAVGGCDDREWFECGIPGENAARRVALSKLRVCRGAQIKRWSARKKAALVEGDLETLRKLSASHDRA